MNPIQIEVTVSLSPETTQFLMDALSLLKSGPVAEMPDLPEPKDPPKAEPKPKAEAKKPEAPKAQPAPKPDPTPATEDALGGFPGDDPEPEEPKDEGPKKTAATAGTHEGALKAIEAAKARGVAIKYIRDVLKNFGANAPAEIPQEKLPSFIAKVDALKGAEGAK
jgi:outer membrane biosynthesis protein TonB